MKIRNMGQKYVTPKSRTWHGPCHQQLGRASSQDTLLLLLLHGQATY